jgi:hypothetical protein
VYVPDILHCEDDARQRFEDAAFAQMSLLPVSMSNLRVCPGDPSVTLAKYKVAKLSSVTERGARFRSLN